MSLGLVGKKLGMSRVFTEEGKSVPVTVLAVAPNRVTQVKTAENDGYEAVQVTTGERRPNRVTKPMAGHFAKANVEPGLGLWEFRIAGGDAGDLAAGGEVSLEIFEAGQRVDVSGTTIGRGFAGGVRRWGFGGSRRAFRPDL